MTDRKNVPYTNDHFMAYCEKMLGQPYWFGTTAYKCTETLQSRKAGQYPEHYGPSRTARYRQDVAAKKVCSDCIGGAKGYAWSDAGKGVVESIGNDKTYNVKYGSNNCPDKGANSMFTYAKANGMDWGVIGTLPEIVGLALHRDGHIGYYAGNGYAIEWRGFAWGCVKTKVAGRGWTHWYKLPFIQYDGRGTMTPPTTEVTLGSRLLKRGMTGADVKALQELLLQLGYRLPKYGADNDYGAETESAVKVFQLDEDIEVDGKYGDKTHAALMAAVADDDEGKPDGQSAEDRPATDPQILTDTRRVVIVSNGGNVNVRVGNSSNCTRVTSVAPGSTFEHVATAPNGWHAIVVGAQVGWVSGQFSKVQ
jgi:hypothetical protein